MPVALTQRWCPRCETTYHGTVLTERRDDAVQSVTFSPCPKCGTVSGSRVEPDEPYWPAFASA